MTNVRDNYEHIAWIDLETTGSDEALDDIIEVGLAVTDRDLDILITKNVVVEPTRPVRLFNMDDVVINMHTKNGLIGDVLKQMKQDDSTIEYADEAIAKVLRLYLTKGRIALGGSGISHFDRQFIKRWMPETHKLLTYWAYDVGVMRRTLRLAGVHIPDEEREALAHRALADVISHIREAKRYIGWFKSIVELQQMKEESNAGTTG